MSCLVVDERLGAKFHEIGGYLERQLLNVIAVPLSRFVGDAAALGADLVVFSCEGLASWSLLDDLRTEPRLQTAPVLCIAPSELSSDEREALAGASVEVAVEPIPPERLAALVASLLNLPTRVTARVPVSFEVRGRSLEEDATVGGRIIDISTGGFRLECERRMTTGEVIHCFFTLPQQDSPLFATARVLRSQSLSGGGFEHGLEFADIRLDDRRRIAEFVRVATSSLPRLA